MNNEKFPDFSVEPEKNIPTRTDIQNLEILIDTKATGANIHVFKGRLALMKGHMTHAEKKGKWEDSHLEDYRRLEATIRRDLLSTRF